jgi:hypothetical protein
LYVDAEVNPSGSIYYRIKQYDFDGASESSNIVSATCGTAGENSCILIPNPSTEGASVQIIGTYKEITITNLLGQAVNCKLVDNRIYNLSSGVYILTFDKVYKVKLIVQ